MDSKHITYLWIFLYACFTSIMYLVYDKFLFDYLTYIALLLFLLMITRKSTLPKLSITLFGLAPLAHSLGTIPFMWKGQEVSLYHSVILNGNYDVATHFIGFMCIAIASLHLHMTLYPQRDWKLLGVLFLALLGMGSLVEITEFLGYALFGFGWGFFAFGEGDNSYNFGPWGDSMTDQIANFLGITTGFIIYFVWLTYLTKKQHIIKNNTYKRSKT